MQNVFLVLACTENTLKEYKRKRRIRQQYFAVHRKYANRHKTESILSSFRPKLKKNQILNHLPIHERMGKKTSHA
jgi:hypothetical protein